MKEFEKLKHYCMEQNLRYDDRTEEQFRLFCHLLIEKNKVMNLTAITDPDEIEIKHFIDSVAGAKWIRFFASESLPEKCFKVIDIGTGAGFPGMPLAFVLPEVQFTLVDSLNKRIDFLNDVICHTGIKNAAAIQGRAEELGQSEYRETYDVCVSRAVAETPVLLEYCLPLVKVGGHVILYKSGEYQEELDSAKNAISILGGKMLKTETFLLPSTEISRSLVIIEKTSETPAKYPRRPGKPSKSPL